MTLTAQLAFIGGGNMAEALIKGVLAGGAVPEAKAIRVADPLKARRTFLADTYGVEVGDDNKQAMDGAGLVILAVKPQTLDQVLVEIQDQVADDQVVVSIAAGVTIAHIHSHLYADTKVVRAMPNTPALVGEGASAVTPGPGVTPEELARVRDLFAAVGSVVIVSEEQMDAVTAVSGSGPAYVFAVIEALADGGVKMGLPRDTAVTLAAQTVLGAARMVLSTGTHPAALKDMVTSPGGTTSAALHVLENAGVRGAFIGAVEAAAKRARELAG
jgi:pyrroline-5-carboxylate reductase